MASTSQSLVAAFSIYHRCESLSLSSGKEITAVLYRNSVLVVCKSALESSIGNGLEFIEAATSLSQLDDCVADLKLHPLYRRLHFNAKLCVLLATHWHSSLHTRGLH